MPSITDVEEFQEKWIVWWGSCQPKWRSTGTWPYTRDDGEGKDWTRLNITGPFGLFAFVMSTSFWAASMSSDLDRGVFDAAVEDLHWVINHLIYFNSQLQVAEPEPTPPADLPDANNRGPGKRKVRPTLKVVSRR